MGCDELSDELRAHLDDVPIFPLPGCVLFPHTLLPLHIFEPRYRQMTEHALAGPSLITMVHSDRAEHVEPVAGVGRIVHHERLKDGRFHILLQGIARVRIVEEHPMVGRLYRRVRARVLDDEPSDPADVEAALRALRIAATELRAVASDPPFGDLPERIHDPSVLADVLCASTISNPEDRQRALAEQGVAARLDLATKGVLDLLLAATPSSEVLH